LDKEVVLELFKKTFGEAPNVLSAAPGRLEVLGNHTDYNDGITLSCAVEQKTYLALKPVEGSKCSIISSMNEELVEFDLDDIETPKKSDWTNYIKGVISQIRKRGKDITAFKAAVHSTVPLSAGMSSSAALEIAAGFAFSQACEIDFSKTEWAKIGQGVENEYIGLGSGLLDQFSSVFGKKNNLIYSDFRTNEVVKNVTVPDGYVFVVANSLVKHDLVDSDYNVRRESCMNVAKVMSDIYPDVKALRDLSVEQLEANKDKVDEVDYRRAMHVVAECARVKLADEALSAGNIEAFGQLLNDSHKSSISNFENSCKELDVLCEIGAAHPACLGARLSGGGFGGISIHLVKKSEAEEFCNYIETKYLDQMGKETVTFICAMGDGASVEKL
jgi:galactokinase